MDRLPLAKNRNITMPHKQTAIAYRDRIAPPGTLVIKVGSRIITSESTGARDPRVAGLVRDIVRLRHSGVRVVLVTSGAIAHGMQELGLAKRPTGLPVQQACACVGQINLINTYKQLFGRARTTIGQVLLTWDDLRDKRRYLNLRNTLFQLLDCNAVPIINENDSVGTDEIAFGDNDTLGGQIAMLVNADLYVILTDVNGLYDAHPGRNTNAQHIPLVEHIDKQVHALASGASSAISVGGMVTKLRAAEHVTKTGIAAIIGNGNDRTLLDVLKTPAAGTLFLPATQRLSSRRRWLAFTRHSSGALTIDKGAVSALVQRGKSLLPAGVKKVTGSFKVGDLVTLCDENGQEIAKGLANYSSTEIAALCGCRSSDITRILGAKSFDEVVHRDNLVLLP